MFAGYTGTKIPFRNRLKIQLIELDFSDSIFQKSSTDQQEVRGDYPLIYNVRKQNNIKSEA